METFYVEKKILKINTRGVNSVTEIILETLFSKALLSVCWKGRFTSVREVCFHLGLKEFKPE